jgi:hypothetical protein
MRQLEEEVGTAEEQPTSNRVVTNTVNGLAKYSWPSFYRMVLWLKKPIYQIGF